MVLLSSPGVQSVFFFVAPRWAPRPFGGARAKKKKKNTAQGVFVLLRPRRRQRKEKPRWAPAGARAKKKTPWVVFFFALAPPKGRGAQRGATKKHFAQPVTTAKKVLETNDTGHEQKGAKTKKTHPGRSARTGVVFFFAVAPPGRSLTHCWLGRIRQGPGGVFFLFCGPAEPGEPITKTVWCTTPGLKRPGGATAKKNTASNRHPQP